jgi:hypothetical protein
MAKIVQRRVKGSGDSKKQQPLGGALKGKPLSPVVKRRPKGK